MRCYLGTRRLQHRAIMQVHTKHRHAVPADSNSCPPPRLAVAVANSTAIVQPLRLVPGTGPLVCGYEDIPHT